MRVLVEHLRDNSWADDAAIAMRQLAHEGVHALPQVESALSGADAQQARLLAHFLARFAPDHPAAHASTARELALLGFDRGDMLADELSTH